MDRHEFWGNMSALGKTLMGVGVLGIGSGAVGITAPSWAPPVLWGIALVGFILSAVGSSWGGKSLTAIVVCLLLMLPGCANRTPAVSEGIDKMGAAYEQGHANDTASYNKMKAANLVNYQRKKDLELKADLQSLEIQSKLDPPKWTTNAIADEAARLHSVHDTAISAYKESIAKADAIRAENETKNYGVARQIRAALNPPKAPAAPVDQTQQIEATGATPQAVPLIEAPGSK